MIFPSLIFDQTEPQFGDCDQAGHLCQGNDSNESNATGTQAGSDGREMYMPVADAGSQYMDGLQNIAPSDDDNGDDAEALGDSEPDGPDLEEPQADSGMQLEPDYGPGPILVPEIGFCASEEAWSL